MQKLPRELKNTPGDAPQVPCSVSFGLNRDDYHNKGDHCGSQCSGHSTAWITAPMWTNLWVYAEALQLKSEILWSGCNPHILTHPIPFGSGLLRKGDKRCK